MGRKFFNLAGILYYDGIKVLKFCEGEIRLRVWYQGR